MVFCSLQFVAFLAGAAALFRLAPPRWRGGVLLAANAAYMASFGGSSLAVLAAVTVLTWCCGRRMAACTGLQRRLWLALGLAASAGYLFARKLAEMLLPAASPVTALGLAFYSLQAASWLADTYTGRCTARPGLLRYALYVGFFPRILSGPIGRAEAFFPQLDEQLARPAPLSEERLRRALTLLLVGYAEKLLLADLLAVPVDTVYADLPAHGGALVLLASVLYAFSLYFDFAGYSHIATGAAALLGIDLAANFRRPFLAQTVAEFWGRWHISLSTWLRDYVYIPLGGSRHGRARKYLNLLLTFLVSGLWHGAAWKFLLWGALNAALQAAGDLSRPLRPRLPGAPGVWWRRFWVLACFVVTMVFFRADGAGEALRALCTVATDLRPAELGPGSLLSLGLTGTEWAFVLAALLAAFVLEVLAERAERRGGSLYAAFSALAAPVRAAALLVLAVLVLLLACRLVGGDAATFYYAEF